MRRRKDSEPVSKAEKHLGLITSRVLHWHGKLPPSARASYDVEDMISDVVLHVLRKESILPEMVVHECRKEEDALVVTRVLRRPSSYDPAMSGESTWVWHVANNFCRDVLARALSQQFSARETVSLDRDVPCERDFSAERDSLRAVERAIEIASDKALALLESIFEGDAPRFPDEEAVADLREASRRSGASLQDFVYAYRSAVS